MPINRRDFLRASAAAAAVAGGRAVTGDPLASAFATTPPAPRAESFVEDLAMEALNAAKDAGASYADARIGRYRRQGINTRERQVTGVSDSESYGLGVRALVGGSWGFAATSTMTKDGVVAAAKEAARLARAARTVQKRPVELAPTPAVQGTWKTPITRDPLDVPIEEKVALLLAANEAARDDGRHARDADVRARRAAVHGHRDRRWRLSELQRGARPARLGLGVRGVVGYDA